MQDDCGAWKERNLERKLKQKSVQLPSSIVWWLGCDCYCCGIGMWPLVPWWLMPLVLLPVPPQQNHGVLMEVPVDEENENRKKSQMRMIYQPPAFTKLFINFIEFGKVIMDLWQKTSVVHNFISDKVLNSFKRAIQCFSFSASHHLFYCMHSHIRNKKQSSKR